MAWSRQPVEQLLELSANGRLSLTTAVQISLATGSHWPVVVIELYQRRTAGATPAVAIRFA
jgi:hypothetical protein